MSNAFSGCSGLDNILKGLEDKGGSVPVVKPQAIKKKHKLKHGGAKAKAKAKAKPKKALAPVAVAPAGAVEVAPAPGDVEVAPAPGAVEVAPAHGAVVVAPALKASRKCVTSRAYHAAKKLCKHDGKSAPEQLAAAQKAYKEAGAKWDQEHA